MNAFVKNIPIGTIVEDGLKKDSFEQKMAKYIGKVVDVEIYPDNWCSVKGNRFNWHKSWFEFNPVLDIQFEFNETLDSVK